VIAILIVVVLYLVASGFLIFLSYRSREITREFYANFSRQLNEVQSALHTLHVGIAAGFEFPMIAHPRKCDDCGITSQQYVEHVGDFTKCFKCLGWSN
jgi:hypothetical protein